MVYKRITGTSVLFYIYIHLLLRFGPGVPFAEVNFGIQSGSCTSRLLLSQLLRTTQLTKQKHPFLLTAKQDFEEDEAPIDVLLVDDEETIRKAVGQYLQDKGYSVTALESAPLAFEALQLSQKLPDVLVTDINMPNVDGYTFVEKLRSKPEFSILPIIFLTARGMTPDRIQGFKSGGNAYISKPFDPEELVSVIENVVKTQRQLKGTSSIDSLRQELVEMRKYLEKQRQQQVYPTEEAPKVTLTGREQSVLHCLTKGMTNKEIAEELGLSLRYVEKVIERLLQKTKTSNRTKLVRYALDTNLI